MDNDGLQANHLLERWFSSDVWTNICESEDDDSIELMEQISGHLGSLVWHIQNDSGEKRVQYELNYFINLCEQFDIPLWT